MPWVGFESTIPVFDWAKTFHTLDRVATVIGMLYVGLTDVQSKELLPRLFVKFTNLYTNKILSSGKKGKAIPVTGRGSPQACETSRLPHFLDTRLTYGGEVVSLTCRPHFTPPPPGRFLVLISVIGWVDPRVIVRLEGLGQLKNPITSLGMKSVTFWLVA
jgi:hypothetical protein